MAQPFAVVTTRSKRALVKLREEGFGRKARVVFAREGEPHTHAVEADYCLVEDRGRGPAVAVFADGYEVSARGMLLAAASRFRGFDLVEGRA